MAKQNKIPKTWTIDDIEKEINRLHKERYWLGVKLEEVVAKEGWGKATTTIDVTIEDLGEEQKRLRAFVDAWKKTGKRPVG